MAIRHNTGPVRGMAAAIDARPSRTWAAGRTCDNPGCTTALSIYNRSPKCSVHEEIRIYIQRGKRRSKGARSRAA
jgi:hypothetical protein